MLIELGVIAYSIRVQVCEICMWCVSFACDHIARTCLFIGFREDRVRYDDYFGNKSHVGMIRAFLQFYTFPFYPQ